MKKILIPVLIVILASFFASEKPDGLDSVSGLLGFSGLEIERHSIMAGYNISFLKEPSLSTIIAGFVGLTIIYSLSLFIKFSSWHISRVPFFKSDYNVFKGKFYKR